jgi:4'-phosphopantetheinyl transferase
VEHHEVHCWSVCLPVPSTACTALYATLSPDERDRSARFRSDRDRQRFIVARGALRELLGRYLRVQPADIRFEYNEFGKPALSAELGSRLTFNLSHSADLALIAVARDVAVGVDVERISEGPPSEYAEIARCFFSAAEVKELRHVPPPLYARAFLTCWTRHEATIKARGEGIGDGPIDASGPIYTLRPAPGYVGALALVSFPRHAESGSCAPLWRRRLHHDAGDRQIPGLRLLRAFVPLRTTA